MSACPQKYPAYIFNGVCFYPLKDARCEKCDLFSASPKTIGELAAYVGGVESKKKTQSIPVTRPSCQMLGENTGGRAQCTEGCGKGVRLDLFYCQIFSACTIARQATGIACCRTCPHYHASHEVAT